jgi:uncharacterized protein (DUF983 family)
VPKKESPIWLVMTIMGIILTVSSSIFIELSKESSNLENFLWMLPGLTLILVSMGIPLIKSILREKKYMKEMEEKSLARIQALEEDIEKRKK